ncbi:hypothetical protein RAS12_25850 [Achromobacter seleniivolatilans]|uniref:Uncharacterized protein n=1 Tax=Achromobacter seleniivolatilans TaxID=3047478 RepID=A0ABY9LZ78_9BURK|nr:hypothetical protein [Achromobacter sp. R39]WMD20000.1 hypothetical protein RAS12_25850 [Achromobacter sp. R39]
MAEPLRKPRPSLVRSTTIHSLYFRVAVWAERLAGLYVRDRTQRKAGAK